MLKNNNYWQERFIKEEDRRNKDARIYLSSIEKQYDKALRNIEKDINNWYLRLSKNNDISLREAKILLSNNELEEFKWTVQEYIEKGQENTISKEWMKQLENASAKVHISKLEALKVQIQNEIEGLYGERLKGMEDYLERIYGDTYYKSAFIIQKGIGIGWSLSTLDTNKINQIIHKPWAIDGKNFSERIWEDKVKLINTLHTGLTQNIIRGSAPDDLIRQISKEFGVKKTIAGRLIMTESAAYSSKAQEQCFKDLDVEKYEIIATLDTSTSKICREMDGVVFPMKDYLVGVTANPFHPNCRTVTAPYFEDDTTSVRAMRTENGKIEYISANMKYDEWYKKYVMKEPEKNGIMKIREKVEKISINNAKVDDILSIGEMIEKEFDIKSSIGNKEKLKEIFSNFREMGGVIPKEVWGKGTSKIVKAQLEDAFLHYPKDWGEIPKKSNRQLYVRKVDRGYFAVGAVKRSGYDISLENFKDGFLTITTNGERVTTPFHEIGHMVEWFNKDIVRLEKEWIEKRTQGEEEIKLSKLFPFSGYSSKEVTKKDNFISPYIGKTYRDATEVLSMGLESLFTGTKQVQSFDIEKREYVKKGIKDDEEFLHLIIGLIVKG